MNRVACNRSWCVRGCSDAVAAPSIAHRGRSATSYNGLGSRQLVRSSEVEIHTSQALFTMTTGRCSIIQVGVDHAEVFCQPLGEAQQGCAVLAAVDAELVLDEPEAD
jgi:hypothetical protein